MSLIREWNDVYEKDLSKIISFLEAEIHNQPTLLILSGPVGAGKTTFSKKLISKLLKEDDNDLEVVSPTYSVINKIDEIVHADFYRIESEEELIHLELSLYLENCKLLIVEWGKDYYSSMKNVERIIKSSFIPLTLGGGIDNIKTAKLFLENMCDKILINTGLFDNSKLISEIANKYGDKTGININEKSLHKKLNLLPRVNNTVKSVQNSYFKPPSTSIAAGWRW